MTIQRLPVAHKFSFLDKRNRNKGTKSENVLRFRIKLDQEKFSPVTSLTKHTLEALGMVIFGVRFRALDINLLYIARTRGA